MGGRVEDAGHGLLVAARDGVLLGTGLALFDQYASKRAKTFVPSASGLGIALVIPGFNSVMMCIGSGLAEWYRRKKGDKKGDEVSVPLASGFIAGESIVGIIIKMLVAFAVLPK